MNTKQDEESPEMHTEVPDELAFNQYVRIGMKDSQTKRFFFILNTTKEDVKELQINVHLNAFKGRV